MKRTPLARSTKPMQRSPMKRGTKPMRSRKPGRRKESVDMDAGKVRSEKLRQLCGLLDCQRCGAPAPSDPAHSNWFEWGGKGGMTKASDVFIAALCRACHEWLDFGPASPR